MKIALAMLLVGGVAYADAAPIPATPVSSIRVIGEALVNVKPDRAQIDVGVLTQSPQSQQAVSLNAQQLDSVLSALHRLLGSAADIRTLNYSLNTNYQYHQNGEQPTVTGYTATNVVRVTLDDLTKVGAVIDTCTQAGANHVESVQFTMRDVHAVRSQALREAALSARADADSLAAALNLKIVRILSAEESRAVAVPMNEVSVTAFRKSAASAPTPIQPGTIEVNASVTLTAEVAPR